MKRKGWKVSRRRHGRPESFVRRLAAIFLVVYRVPGAWACRVDEVASTITWSAPDLAARAAEEERRKLLARSLDLLLPVEKEPEHMGRMLAELTAPERLALLRRLLRAVKNRGET